MSSFLSLYVSFPREVAELDIEVFKVACYHNFRVDEVVFDASNFIFEGKIGRGVVLVYICSHNEASKFRV